MSPAIYYANHSATVVSLEHFYKFHRFVFFRKFIFTIDIYPEETRFGFMIAATKYQWTFLNLKGQT